MIMTSIPIDSIRQARTLWMIAAVSAFRLCGYSELLYKCSIRCLLSVASNAGQITSVVLRLPRVRWTYEF